MSESKTRERRESFSTLSGLPIERLYGPEHVAALDYARDIQDPGEPPYVRGVHRSGHRDELWTMRQSAGAGTPEDANRRCKDLIAAGATGLCVTFDAPTRHGCDPDDASARGAVGRRGVSVASLADMERFFDGIPLADIEPAMAIDGRAAMIFAMYLVVAERQGVDWKTLSGTIQHDVLIERIVGEASPFPMASSMRLVAEVASFCSTAVPRWQPIEVGGYALREAGATVVQELALALGAGLEYVRQGVDAGVDIDAAAMRVSCCFGAHSDFFEEIAKLRAARKLWAGAMRDRFGAKDPRAWQLRAHVRTAGAALTVQQPYNNAVRTALQTMAAVLGGADTLQTAALDEPLARSTDAAAALALRTQQIVAHESGVTEAADPLGGSYFVEALTHEMEQQVRRSWEAMDGAGGLLPAIERGVPQREIAGAAARARQAIERREQLIVGVNEQVQEAEASLDVGRDDSAAEQTQIERLVALKASRNNAAVGRALDALRQTARAGGPTLPAILDCARAYATIGEISAALTDSR